MRCRVFVLAAFAVLMARPALADDARTIIGRQLQELMDALPPGNAAVWEKYLDPDCLYVEEGDTINSKADMVKEVAPMPKGMGGSIVSEILRFHRDGDIAVVVSRDHETENYFGQTLHAEYLNTSTWRKRTDGWKLIAQQVLAEPIDPPAITLPADRLTQYAGSYRLKDSDVVYTVTVTGGKLTGEKAGKPPATLNAEVSDVFFVAGQPRIRKIFVRDGTGVVIGFMDRREGRDVVWLKIG
jgi:ketosteroid isomerase-like protein